MEFSAGPFVAKRLQLEPADGSSEAAAHAIWKSHLLLGKLAAHKHFFTDYSRGCMGECAGFCNNASPACATVKQRIVSTLLNKNAILWEVWKHDAGKIDFCGILRLSEVEPKCSAKAHYMFFDQRLKEKTPILLAWKDWVFSKLGLHRVGVEIPAHAYALAKHAYRDLGFGGSVPYNGIKVEGIMEQAVKWNGSWHDLLLMGCVADG